MIGQLKTLLESATEPSRELDCMMHECMTGQLNLSVDKEDRAYNLKHGRMLLDMGSQRLWMDIPCYTEIADACDVLIDKRFAWSASRLPAGMQLGKYGAALFLDNGRDCVAFAHHDASASLALCLAIVVHACSH